jgi:hypothetical protein
LTYMWGAFVVGAVKGHTGTVHLIGNLIFALGALVLLGAAARSVRATRGLSGGQMGSAVTSESGR